MVVYTTMAQFKNGWCGRKLFIRLEPSVKSYRQAYLGFTMDTKKEEERELSLDNILAELGELGRYQVLQYLYLAIIVVVTSVAFFSYVFTTGQLDYR